jgi:hypothetical protein
VPFVFKSIPNYSRTLKIGRLAFIAFLALKKDADAAGPTGFARYPFSRDERRLVPDMLVVTTLEFSAPIALVILVEANDLSFHLPLIATASGFPPEDDRQGDQPADARCDYKRRQLAKVMGERGFNSSG